MMIVTIAIFSYVILGETFGIQGYLGAAMIMMGIWITARSTFVSNHTKPVTAASSSES
jgi:drug/metabolite transporter (DMT)-like permease